LIAEYPYVPVYRVLLAQKRKVGNGDEYREALHQAALHSPDRIRLYELLHAKEADETVKEKKVRKVRKKSASKKQKKVVEKAVGPEVNTETAEAPEPVEEVKEVKPIEEEQIIPAIEVKSEIESQTEEVNLKDTLLKSAAEQHVSMDEKHTFLEWLDILEHPETKPIEETDQELERQVVEHHAASSYEAEMHEEVRMLEDEVDEEEESGKVFKKVEKLADKSITAGVGLATETFAKILLKQGKISEAIAVYQQLRLKYPEKSDYFAALISDIKAR